jgi:hypothetical protein
MEQGLEFTKEVLRLTANHRHAVVAPCSLCLLRGQAEARRRDLENWLAAPAIFSDAPEVAP